MKEQLNFEKTENAVLSCKNGLNSNQVKSVVEKTPINRNGLETKRTFISKF